MAAGSRRLVAFAGFAALAAAQWASLLAAPPVLPLAVVAMIALVTAWALASLRSPAPPRVLLRLVRPAAIVLAALLGSLLALGFPLADLLPWGWGHLASEIDRGIAGLSGQFDYPYDGGNDSSRRLLLTGMPLMLIAAAVLGFRPGERDRRPTGALLLLFAAVAIPATIRPTPSPLLWGAALLVPAAFWIWERPPRALAAAATVTCLGLLAVPIASALDQRGPVIDYREWTIPQANSGLGYEWDQDYGPIDWPRTDEVLFEVRSDQPRYWRAEVLDDFFGLAWRRSRTGGVPVSGEPPVGGAFTAPLGSEQQRWVHTAEFSVESLRSPLVVSPGSAIDVRGLDGTVRDLDGTVHANRDPLSSGTEYSVTAYTPDPSSDLMRARSKRYPDALDFYTTVALPYGVGDPKTDVLAVQRIPMTMWGQRERDGGTAAATVARSPYARVATLARRLTASEPTAYDAVKAVESYLQSNYRYDESPPERRIPLRSFLLEDRIGFCQHFSGTMALMLRFAGIPARVAAGFAPGTLQGARGERQSTYAVSGLDAHSWVEVYFNGIGWVPFDPTPAAAPAQSQVGGAEAASSALGAGALGADDRAAARAREPDFNRGSSRVREADDASSGGIGASLMLGILIMGGVGLLLTSARAIRHGLLSDGAVLERQLRELSAALEPAGLRSSGPITLSRLEDRLRNGTLLAAATYVRHLAELRYGPDPGAPPSLAERRAARRELSSGGGPARNLRMLAAMPPGGPRR